MKRPQTLLFFLLLPLGYASAQSGPGGVSSGSANVLMWLDGQHVNADGSNPTVGNTVSTWFDQSGNGVNVTESTSNVATYVSSGVQFNNTGYLGGSDASFPTGNAARSVIICASSPSTGNDDVFFFYGTAANNQSYGILKISSGGGNPNGVRNYFYANDFDLAGGWTPSGTLKIITTTYTNNTQAVHINNDAGSTRTPTTPNTTLGAQGVQIGGWNSFSLFSNATIAEVIVYDKLLNPAERIIINNYLAAKYGLTLAANDLYDNDAPFNGNYDFDVAGIGRAASAAQVNNDAISSIVEISGASGMGNGEYYIWGHDNGALTPTTAGIPAGVETRLARIWRGSHVGNITDFDVDFDMTGLGSVVAGDLRLLIDADGDGSFADETVGSGGIVSGATSLGGNIYRFANVTGLNNDIRFTLASANATTTPLPVTLTNFTARQVGSDVELFWSTVTESDNDHFLIERSQKGIALDSLATVAGAGDSNSPLDYYLTDHHPFDGLSYYRLSQIDYDGTITYFPVISVHTNLPTALSIHPNPGNGNSFVIDNINVEPGLSVAIIDAQGREVYRSKVMPDHGEVSRSIDVTPSRPLNPGVYNVVITTHRNRYVEKLVVL